MKLASFYVDFKARKGVDVTELKTFVDNYIDNYKLAIIPSSYESNSIRVYGDANALDEILMTILILMKKLRLLRIQKIKKQNVE